MTVATSWSQITGWLAVHHPTAATLVNPPATPVDLRYLQAAMNRPLPTDLIELLELANGTQHRAIRGSLIPTFYNLMPVMEMLSSRKMLQEIQRGIGGSGPWPGDSQPAGHLAADWLDGFLPIADSYDAAVVYVDLRDGDQFGCVVEWYADDEASAPWWGSVTEMLDDVAQALNDGRPALQSYSNGAIWPEKRLRPKLAEIDDGYLRWFTAHD